MLLSANAAFCWRTKNTPRRRAGGSSDHLLHGDIASHSVLRGFFCLSCVFCLHPCRALPLSSSLPLSLSLVCTVICFIFFPPTACNFLQPRLAHTVTALCISFSLASCFVCLSYFFWGVGGWSVSPLYSLPTLCPLPAPWPSIWTCRAVCAEQNSTPDAAVVCCRAKSCPLSSP